MPTLGNSCATLADVAQQIGIGTFQEGDDFREALLLLDESAADLRNPLNLDSEDEDSFDESIECNCVAEPEGLQSENEMIKDAMDSITCAIENENARTNQSTEEIQQPPIISAIAISSLNANDFKNMRGREVAILVRKERQS